MPDKLVISSGYAFIIYQKSPFCNAHSRFSAQATYRAQIVLGFRQINQGAPASEDLSVLGIDFSKNMEDFRHKVESAQPSDSINAKRRSRREPSPSLLIFLGGKVLFLHAQISNQLFRRYEDLSTALSRTDCNALRQLRRFVDIGRVRFLHADG